MFGYIYKTTCLLNNKIYIGQKMSSNFIANYFGSGKLLKKALKKYGKQNFKIEILCWANDKQNLNDLERYWIKTLNSRVPAIGYNLAEGGEGSNGGGFKGKHHTKETLDKLKQAAINDNLKRKESGWVPFNFDHHRSPANKGCIKIYNEQLNIIKYIKKEDLIKYPGFIVGTPKTSNLAYLQDNNYMEQLKARFKGTKFIHNDKLCSCKRIKEEDVADFISVGWELGRKYYK